MKKEKPKRVRVVVSNPDTLKSKCITLYDTTIEEVYALVKKRLDETCK